MKYITVILNQLSWALPMCIILIAKSCIAHIRFYDEDLDSSDELFNRSRKVSHGRIAGGYPIKEGQYPSFVGLGASGDQRDATCSGVAIRNDLILTAAHCFEGDEWKIYAAPSIWSPTLWYSKRVKTYEVEKQCRSSEYEIGSDEPAHDYQVLRLKKPMANIKPALMPIKPVEEGFKGTLVGSGKTGIEGKDDTAQALPVEIISCDEELRDPTRICFRSYKPQYVGDACEGDSGGPLYKKTRGGELIVIGLTSFGKSTCQKGESGVSVAADLYNGQKEILEAVKKCTS